MQDLVDFLQPVNKSAISNDNGYTDGQLAKHISIFETELPDITDADIILIGTHETRGGNAFLGNIHAADVVRKYLYKLHYWHDSLSIVDIGNVKIGENLIDSYAALKTILAELMRLDKTVIILGGSHDVTLAQYMAYKELEQVVEATCIDAMIDLRVESMVRSENFLLEMLTSEPNMVKHYNHIGFQSYFVHPRMLETMDKLRFDCFRVGIVKEDIEEMEPVLRNTNLLSLDISAIKYSDSPASLDTPNGLTGEEACILTRYAGMSNKLNSFGIYGYNPQDDVEDLTAKQIAQMIWYFFDGKNRSKQESGIEERQQFNEYHTAFAEVDTVFLQSKKTNRWWMQLPDRKFAPCSYNDYLKASHNEIPERWLRIQERG